MASYLSRAGTVCTRGVDGIGGEGKGRWLRLRWFALGASWVAIYSSIPSSALFNADVDAGLVALVALVPTDFSIEAALFVLFGLASSSASLSGRGRLRDPSLLEDGISFIQATGLGNRLARLRTSGNLNYALILRVRITMSFITANTQKLSTLQEASCPRMPSVFSRTAVVEPQTGVN
jgi:hypothetical protein